MSKNAKKKPFLIMAITDEEQKLMAKYHFLKGASSQSLDKNYYRMELKNIKGQLGKTDCELIYCEGCYDCIKTWHTHAEGMKND